MARNCNKNKQPELKRFLWYTKAKYKKRVVASTYRQRQLRFPQGHVVPLAAAQCPVVSPSGPEPRIGWGEHRVVVLICLESAITWQLVKKEKKYSKPEVEEGVNLIEEARGYIPACSARA